ncbi:MAG: DUF98 domain-containing protein [Hahellaceae bacterium]|jgi:chorismate-pyruvate lyase|nr:DUF98 domain-containing protein [Hahellaceae bacterium]
MTCDVAATFRSKGYASCVHLQGCGHDYDFSELPAILRVLLLQDGTVTKTLEAFFWEPVTVGRLEQNIAPLNMGARLPDVAPEISVLHRTVDIRGDHTQQLYCRATSLIRLDLLPANVADLLTAGKIGIGELLRDKGLETYRELNDLFVSKAEQGEVQIARHYLVYIQQTAAISITEYFPLSVYQDY